MSTGSHGCVSGESPPPTSGSSASDRRTQRRRTGRAVRHVDASQDEDIATAGRPLTKRERGKGSPARRSAARLRALTFLLMSSSRALSWAL
eukprot:6920540-Pyramimonas_sp.AAC.1